DRFEGVEISKLPIPRVLLKGVTLPGGIKADSVSVSLNGKSIVNRAPKISFINILFAGNSLQIPVNYLDGKTPSFGTVNVNAGNISMILSSYPDLWKTASPMLNNKNTIVTFDIVDSESSTDLKNFKISSQNFVAAGEISIPRDGNGCSIKLEFEKFILCQDELRKIDFLVTTKGDRHIVIDSCSGEIASGGSFKISGDLTRDDNRSLFLGHIDVAHNNVSLLMKKLSSGNDSQNSSATEAGVLSADIKITQIEMILKNIIASFGDIKLSGTTAVQVIGKQPRISCNMKVDGFDLSKKTPVLSDIIDYFVSLTKDMKEQNYDAKFIALRNIQYLVSFKLDMESPLIFGSKPDYIKISGTVLPGKFSMDEIEYKYGNDHINASANLSTTIVMPKLQITISSGTIDITNFKIQDLLDFNSYASKNYEFSKVSLTFDASLDEVTNGETKYTNLQLSAYNNDNTIAISKASYKIGDADFAGNGTILVALPTAFNIGYTCNSVDILDITGFVVKGFSDLSGFISSTGSIASNGSSVEELLYNLGIKADFIAEKITIAGYNIDGIIARVNNPKYIWSNKQLDMINAMNGGQQQQQNAHSANSPLILDKDFEIATSSGSSDLLKVKGNVSMDKGVIIINNMAFVTASSTGAVFGSYDIYKQDLQIQSDVKFSLYLSESFNTDTKFSIILENNDNLFEKYIDTGTLQSDLAKRPISQFSGR
ncbi:MAG: hypothetical protein KA998_04075, partial [Rickettsiaceae bacterium]|nr:hypothetical protein [Rickettsiaceae bacterium]